MGEHLHRLTRYHEAGTHAGCFDFSAEGSYHRGSVAESVSVPNATYALRFISGKYQGGEFPLRMDREIIVGRSSELDMVLVEDMVSRKHAKISAAQDQIFIQDLGSTNGTFV